MNVNQIEIALSQKISASSTNFDLLAASKALQFLKTNGVFVVSGVSALPAAASNEGKIYFIESIETVVWSNGTAWLKLLDKSASTTQLWVWGSNSAGRLGDGTASNRSSPVREFCSATDWCQVSVGGCGAAAVKTSGELWAWGSGSCGGLGDGTLTTRCSPVREFCSATDWCQVSAGYYFSSAIKTSGELWAWGNNFYGRLGDGTVTDKCSPVREICSATDWCQVSAGGGHISAVKTSGELWAWGSNGNGRLGDGTLTTRCSPVREFCSATNWCQVAAGRCHTAAVKTSGELWAWGNGALGALGDGTTACRCSPVREFCSATNWCQVSAGQCHTAAVKTSGELWSWGCGTCGSLGNGLTASHCSPVREFYSATDWYQASAGSSHSLAIKTSGQLWGFGRQRIFTTNVTVLGDGTNISRCSPVREFCSATDWYQVSTGGGHSSAIKIIV